MNKVRDLVDLSKVYEAVNGPKLKDPKAKFGTKPGKPLNSIPEVKIKKTLQDDGQPKQPFFHKDSGPENADGFKKDIVDPKTSKPDNAYEPEKFSDNVKKSVKEDINNFMKDKSIFDKLYEEVMGGSPEQEELDAVELDIKPEGDAEGTAEEVSFSLPRDVAQKLHDSLMAALGGGESEGEDMSGEGETEGQEDLGSEEAEEGKKEKEEDKDEVAGEGVDAEVIGHPIVDGEKLNKGLNKVASGSNVVPSEVSTAGKKAGKGGDGKVTDKVGNDGDEGHPLVNQKKGGADSVKGKSNVVNSRIKGNNQSAFNV
jgi:hypothetical protein